MKRLDFLLDVVYCHYYRFSMRKYGPNPDTRLAMNMLELILDSLILFSILVGFLAFSQLPTLSIFLPLVIIMYIINFYVRNRYRRGGHESVKFTYREDYLNVRGGKLLAILLPSLSITLAIAAFLLALFHGLSK
ncbi:MAG: hypothetical protein IJ775_04570 [Muribaculaceae bacterium]|nr:hypothetical protein [Muribaculaceae bacterium]